jgi:hypothetical protein
MPSPDREGVAATSAPKRAPAIASKPGAVMMKAIAVRPGIPNSMHLAQLPKPAVDEVPDGRGVLVKVMRVGVDGTERRSTRPSTARPRRATISW